MRVFVSESDRVKEAFLEESKNFCDMIDCVDEPISFDYEVNKWGIKIRISVEVV